MPQQLVGQEIWTEGVERYYRARRGRDREGTMIHSSGLGNMIGEFVRDDDYLRRSEPSQPKQSGSSLAEERDETW